MTSLLEPGYTLVLGSQQWTRQLLRLKLTLEVAPLVDLLDVQLPAVAPLTAAMGDDVELTLQSGEKEAKVFTGKIVGIRRSLDDIRVSCMNAGAVLARFRPAATYEQINAGNVVRSLCDDAGVDTASLEEGVSLAYYAADPSRTALQHTARVCGWSGAIARISNENEVESLVVNATQADVALKYGREILRTWQWTLDGPIQSFVVSGESGAGSTSAPEALRPSTDFFGGKRPDGPSPTSRWFAEPALRTGPAAASAAAALQRCYNSNREVGRMEAFLQPDLRPGTILQIQELPNQLPSNPLFLYRVQHWLDSNGGRTQAHFSKGGDAFDPLALLGSLGGTIGGLL